MPRRALSAPRTLLLVALLGSCKQEQQPAPAYAAYGSYPNAPPVASPSPAPTAAPPSTGTAPATPVTAPGGVPAPSAAGAASLSPAFGFFCATDRDPQCPFGRCTGGRCGGCSSAADCKPGAQCVASFVGQVCLPGGTATTTPSAPPAPATASLPAPPAGGSDIERARQLCVQRSNEYRARVGVAPVTRRTDAEPCGDAQAHSDGISRTAHGAFGQCRERAQNECPAWDGDPGTVVDRCLAMMFAEGPGSGPSHGHYVNMTDRQYSGVSCGFATDPSGQLWVVQDFY